MDVEEEEPGECYPVDPSEIFANPGPDFYATGVQYWSQRDDSIDGMLEGRIDTHEPDLIFSREFLQNYLNTHTVTLERLADVACGVGRVSIGFLANFVAHISLVEPISKFVHKAADGLRAMGIDVSVYCCGAEAWNISEFYDCFWLQWVLMFLTDDDAVRFLLLCKAHIRNNGFLIVKENLTTDDEGSQSLWWPADNSIARTPDQERQLFAAAGLRIEVEDRQAPWPEDLLPVLMFALVPQDRA
jgi:protein N-terminal methyltransferase